MQAKKSKGKATTKRALKDLSPKKTSSAKGGSQSSGAGAGKVTFNPLQITKTVDAASPGLFL